MYEDIIEHRASGPVGAGKKRQYTYEDACMLHRTCAFELLKLKQARRANPETFAANKKLEGVRDLCGSV